MEDIQIDRSLFQRNTHPGAASQWPPHHSIDRPHSPPLPLTKTSTRSPRKSLAGPKKYSHPSAPTQNPHKHCPQNSDQKKTPLLIKRRAGRGNRTLITSLEGWGFTIKLYPHSPSVLCYNKTDHGHRCLRNPTWFYRPFQSVHQSISKITGNAFLPLCQRYFLSQKNS